jgi:hypothetical protein
MNPEQQSPILQEISQDAELMEQLKKVVLERVGTMPDSLNLAIGSSEITKSALLEHVRQQDEIGRQFMEMELEFMRDLGSGAVYGSK